MALHRQVLLQLIMLLWSIKVSTSSKLPCKQSCGNVVIWYPYGIEDGCYHDNWFKVTCNSSSPAGSPKAFLDSINLEIRGDIFYSSYTAVVKFPTNPQRLNLQRSPFFISTTHNRVIAFGCDKYATMNENDSTTIGCLSTCTCAPTDQNRGCCYFVCPISPKEKFNSTHLTSVANAHQCKSAFLVDNQYLESINQKDLQDLKEKQYLPVRLGWGQRKGRCSELFASGNKSCNKDKYCLIALNSGYYCLCDDIASDGFQGCVGDFVCNATNGQHCSEECPPGYETHYYEDQRKWCSSRRTLSDLLKENRQDRYVVIIGCSAGLGMLMFLLIGAWWSYKFIRRRKEMRMKKNFFRRNGGLLLQQHMSSNEDSIAKTRLFTSKELRKATDNYNVNRILGQGGQGTVYKGMLEEGRIVAIKKSKIVDGSKVEEFINEVVILSQINHKNVVQLLGCCLETEVPLLVYEFISNGTLFQRLHDENEEFPITWELRLRIATEVAGALSYLHSAASTPIYHRDIKSTNILLDEKYRAKVSDFGTSRSVMVDQTHLTTRVQGTYGYIDPEYFQSSQFTEKSDVYSFGVVLAELLTRQKPIRLIDCDDCKSLATYFLEAIEENQLFEILDARVLKESEQVEIMAIANLIRRCLDLNGKKRPTMREVATELDRIRASNMAVTMQQSGGENDCVEDERFSNWSL